MKGQLLYKILLFLVCSCFVTLTFAQDEPPTLPNDPENVTDYLPLTLISFSASLQSGNTELFWNTANEVNMRNFLLERSTDGKIFSAITSVLAENKATNNYSFIDNNAIQDIVYYRLKMNNMDGSYQYSFIINIKNKTKASISIYPNPAINYVTVTHDISTSVASLLIFNTLGKKVQTTAVASGTQQTSFTLNNNLIPGIYLLQFINDKGVQTLQFMKQ